MVSLLITFFPVYFLVWYFSIMQYFAQTAQIHHVKQGLAIIYNSRDSHGLSTGQQMPLEKTTCMEFICESGSLGTPACQRSFVTAKPN